MQKSLYLLAFIILPGILNGMYKKPPLAQPYNSRGYYDTSVLSGPDRKYYEKKEQEARKKVAKEHYAAIKKREKAEAKIQNKNSK